METPSPKTELPAQEWTAEDDAGLELYAAGVRFADLRDYYPVASKIARELLRQRASQREELERLTKENDQMCDVLVKVEVALDAVHQRHDIDAMACDTFAEEIALLGDVIQSRDEQLVLAGEAIIAKDAEIEEQRDELSSYAEEHEMLRLILGCPDETATLEQARRVMSTLDLLRSQLAKPENSNV